MTEEEEVNAINGMDKAALIHGIMGSRTVSFAELLTTNRYNKLKKVTKLATSKKKHPVCSYTSPDPYTWMDGFGLLFNKMILDFRFTI